MIDRLTQQMSFIQEIDKLKLVIRQSYLMDASRQENDAEHTWHIAMMAVILLEHVTEPLPDISKVLTMLLIHDLVEIDAGDTFAYDEQGNLGKFDREKIAAERIFGLLPADQRDELFALWLEFEDRNTKEARYAAAVDRLQPLMHNYGTQGIAWRKHGVTRDKVMLRIADLQETVPELYSFATRMIDDAVTKGYLGQ